MFENLAKNKTAPIRHAFAKWDQTTNIAARSVRLWSTRRTWPVSAVPR